MRGADMKNKMRLSVLAVMLCAVLFTACGKEAASNEILQDRDCMYQVSLLQGLTFGDYYGSITVEELEKNGLEFEQAEVTLIPSTYVSLDEEKGRKMQLLIDHLDDLDDVLEVYHNWEE